MFILFILYLYPFFCFQLKVGEPILLLTLFLIVFNSSTIEFSLSMLSSTAGFLLNIFALRLPALLNRFPLFSKSSGCSKVIVKYLLNVHCEL